MNTGQMMLVVAALMLLSTITLSVNRTLLETDWASVAAQSGIVAVSLCEGQVDALVSTDFDSLAVGTSADTLNTPFAAFVCTTRVDYVEASAPDVAVTGPTDYKRMRVTVSGEYMTGGVTLSAIVGNY